MTIPEPLATGADAPIYTRIAERVDKTPVLAPMLEQPAPANDGFPLNADGSIDNKEYTNRCARDVAVLLDAEMDCSDPVFCSGIVVLAGNPLRFKAKDVSHFTGLPRVFCDHVCFNLRYSKLIRDGMIGGEIHAELERGADKADGSMMRVLFVMYALVGAGQVHVSYDKKREALYGLVHASDPHVYRIGKVA